MSSRQRHLLCCGGEMSLGWEERDVEKRMCLGEAGGGGGWGRGSSAFDHPC